MFLIVFRERTDLRDDWVLESPFDIHIGLRHDTTVVRISQTHYQFLNMVSWDHNKNGELALKNNNTRTAIKYFSQAFKNAQNSDIKQISRQNLSKSHATLAKQQIDSALSAEVKGQTTEAEKYFNEAKTHLEEAKSLVNSTFNQSRLNFIKLKISGNHLINSAVKTEEEAASLFDAALKSADIDAASVVAKYNEALAQYREALAKYNEASKLGVANLSQSTKITEEQISELEVVVANMENVLLRERLKKMEKQTRDTTKGQAAKQEYIEHLDVVYE